MLDVSDETQNNTEREQDVLDVLRLLNEFGDLLENIENNYWSHNSCLDDTVEVDSDRKSFLQPPADLR